MHSYLIVGNSPDQIDENIKLLTKKLGASHLEFPLTKINDVRNLISFTSKSFAKRVAIVIKEIDSASYASLNAFLKNLEEPQKNCFYILTATSLHKLPATIVSRCQIIKIGITNKLNEIQKENISKFLDLDSVEQILYVRKIKDRQEARNFCAELTIALHKKLISEPSNRANTSQRLRSIIETANRLSANTNVALQLGNLVISLV